MKHSRNSLAAVYQTSSIVAHHDELVPGSLPGEANEIGILGETTIKRTSYILHSMTVIINLPWFLCFWLGLSPSFLSPRMVQLVAVQSWLCRRFVLADILAIAFMKLGVLDVF